MIDVPAVTSSIDLPSRVDGLLANTSTAVVTADTRGIMRYLSPGVGTSLGYDTASTAGSSIFDFQYPGDEDRAAQLFAQRLAVPGADLGHQLPVRHASSDFLDVEVTAMLLPESPLGVFAIDDFGTGYSSLVYLKRFPVDAIEIDRGFVDELATSNENRVIVESIISLERALSLEVGAEGVENRRPARAAA